jgi:hypothetical protein
MTSKWTDLNFKVEPEYHQKFRLMAAIQGNGSYLPRALRGKRGAACSRRLKSVLPLSAQIISRLRNLGPKWPPAVPALRRAVE